MPNIAFLVQRIGPYHHARLNALAAVAGFRVTAIEFRLDEKVNSWDSVRADGKYSRIQVRTRPEMRRALEGIGTDVVVCTGYSDAEVHFAMSWALRRGVPRVTCSDSNYEDDPRTLLKESLKRRVVSAFDSALVAGRRSRDYIKRLGLKEAQCFEPWDVVDNDHFTSGADAARSRAEVERERLALPERYFLCVARFVPQKNLGGLIEAYAGYSVQTGSDAWSLVLSGSGPLEDALRRQVAAAGVADRVHFPGFLGYTELPGYFGLASAFVLPSKSDQWGLVVNEAMAAGLPVLVSSKCGCAPDLVLDGENGFTFDPDTVSSLHLRLVRMAQLGRREREKMGARSREIVAAYSPAAFARGLSLAVASAVQRAGRRAPLQSRIMLGLLGSRGTGGS